MTCLEAQFEVAPSNGLCGDIFTRNVMDAHTHRRTDRQTDEQWTNLGSELIYLFSKEKSRYNKDKVFQSNMSKNTVDGNCMTKKC